MAAKNLARRVAPDLAFGQAFADADGPKSVFLRMNRQA
jgi:hypothetical protein